MRPVVDGFDDRVERVVGTPPTFDFAPQAHWDLGPRLGILDFERGVKVAAARFTVLLGDGRPVADAPTAEVLGGGWYFATQTARVLGQGALTPEQGAALLAAPREVTA